jgi:hypothetical protein
VEWYGQGKTNNLGKKPVPMPLCPPQIPHGLIRAPNCLSQGMASWQVFFFREGGVGLPPKHACLLRLAYYAFPRWYEFGERWWDDIDRGKPKNSEKTYPSATLSATNLTWIDHGANPGLHDEIPATNDLSHGARARAHARTHTHTHTHTHTLSLSLSLSLLLSFLWEMKIYLLFAVI